MGDATCQKGESGVDRDADWGELVAEGKRMRDQMAQRGGSQPGEWLEGIDDLAPGNYDLLTMTVLLPA